MGKKIDLFVLQVALAAAFYLYFRGAFANRIVALVLALLSCFVLLWQCTREGCIQISLRNFAFSWQGLRDIFSGGFSSLLKNGLSSLASVLLNRAARPYGDAAIAAFIVVNRLVHMCQQIYFGIGEGYQTFPVMIYNAYRGEGGADRNFAAALAVVAVVITAIVFAIQKWGTNRFKFSMNALHPVEKKEAKGVFGFLMHAYCYLLVGIAFMPQLYIIYLSFCNYKGSIRQGGYGFGNYVQASKKLLSRSIKNTAVMGIIALIVIVILAVLIAYLVVRRASALNNAIDTISMLPYIMPGAVVGLALLLAFGKKPLALTGTFAIMVISFVIRRLPYTIRSATATLMQISPSIEEAAISLGASKAKTFVRITVPMMANGILSGAILSWVAIVTELSSSIILYSNKSITLTMSTYLAILRGNDGIAAAFAAILTVVTAVSLLLYLKVSKSEDVRL